MEDWLPFLEKYELFIYIIVGVFSLYFLSQVLDAWREWRGAIFGLEREKAQGRLAFRATMLVILLLFGLTEFYLVTFIAPTYPGAHSLATPTLDIMATPEMTIPAAAAQSIPTPEPTQASDVVDPQVVRTGCLEDQIEWTYPVNGDEIKGLIEPMGTVNVPNLGFYKYEYSPADAENWTTIAGGDQPKVDQPLGGIWNTEQVVPGDYQLRLVVYDNQNNPFPACIISVRILGS